jgi:signal transduction histidine kinase
VHGDEAQLDLLFQNLLDNALKFRGADPPRIRIEATEDPGFWHLRVQDNGTGIPVKDQERIFALFQRLHTAREAPGTGIGLALCRRIVARHGGRIWVESLPGEGSTFHFTLARPAGAGPDLSRGPNR